MSSQSCNFFHGWVLPNIDLVEWIAMCWYNLVSCLRKNEIADLGTGVDIVNRLESMCVPKSNAFISSTTTCRKKTGLIWIPSNCFNCSLMLTEFGLGLIWWKVPDHKFVVVSTTGKLSSIEWPFKAADFSFMTFMLVCDWVSDSEISAQNHSISWSCAHCWAIPWDGANSIDMTSDSSHFLERCSIPYLCISRFCSNS